jgi:hypothetical protein
VEQGGTERKLSYATRVAHARIEVVMVRASESGGANETRVSDEGSVVELAKRAGIHALVGFEFFYAQPGEYGHKKVRIEKVNPDGQTLSVIDVGEKRLIEKKLFPGELTVGAESRARNDPVIRFLRQVKIRAQPFLDPNLRVQPQEAEEYRTPASRLDNLAPLRKSAPPVNPQAVRPELGAGFRAATPSPRGQFFQPVKGENSQGGGRGFRPFRPMFRGARQAQSFPLGPPDRREQEQLRGGRGYVPGFGR